MADINVKFINQSFAKIECDQAITNELGYRYTFYAPNYRFDRRYKMGQWDGKIRLFNRTNGFLPTGLLKDLAAFVSECGYSWRLDKNLIPRGMQGGLEFSDVADICEALSPYDRDVPLKHHEYQISYIHHALKYNRSVLLSPTSSGKSLILYSLVRILTDQNLVDGKVLLIVPDVGLIHQMFSDFGNYSNKQIDTWNVLNKVHCIYAGQQKDTDKQIVISTYQSLNTIEDPEWFKQFEAVFVDECHLAKAKTIKKVMEACTEAWMRIGTTGTLDGEKVNELTITGLFGPPVEFVTTKEMIDMGAATRLKIESIFYSYDQEIREHLSGSDYRAELKFLVGSNNRNRALTDLICSLPGNTLVLVNYIAHGKHLAGLVESRADWDVINISGEQDGGERKELYDYIGTLSKSSTIATYKTLSTGVSIKNFHNMIFAHPSKGRIRVLQSIGRGLRKHHTKDEIILYDVVDDLRHNGIINYAVQHFAKRFEIYQQQKFNVNISVRKIND